MSYALDTLILSPSVTTAAQKQAWLEARGRLAAPRFAPDGQYSPPPPAIGMLVEAEAARWERATNSDVLMAMIDVESAAWQSALARDKNNPSGFGAEDHDPYTLAHTFPTPQRAIEATNAKLRNYAAGPGPWSELDPRFDKIPVAWRGTTKRVRDLGNGRWATDPNYAGKILDRLNALVAFAATMPMDSQPGGPVTTPYEHIVPGMIDLRPQLRRNPGGRSAGRLPLDRKRGIVIHFNGPDVGTNDRQHIINVASYHCDKNWNTNPAGPHIAGDGIMYHLAVADDGVVYLLRDFEAGLWHSGSSWNDHSFAIYVPIGINQRATPAQLQKLTWLVDRLRAQTGEGREQVKGHQELSGTNCPGTLMADFVRPYRAGTTGPVIVEPGPAPEIPHMQLDPWRFDEAATNYAALWNGGQPFVVLSPFVDWLHQRGGLATMGYVTSGAFIEDGLLVQYFEGGRLEWHPGNPPEHRVLRGHTGLEVLRARHPERVPA